ncbi:hypothetical protein EBR66_01520 [bacterium]|nr:hypothetical protein [bacterium]
MAQKKKVAVFDVDGTIFRSSLFVELTERLIDKGVFPQYARGVYERAHKRWIEREGDYEAYIGGVVEAFRTHIQGVYYGIFADTAKEVVNAHWKRTYRFTRDLIQDLKMKDYFLLAVSHSPKTILDQFCPRLGFDKVYGVMYELGAQDRFTGEIMDEHLIFNKASIVKRALEKENLTLTRSIGVGDTEGDISFLELMAKPICFNPNQKLYRYARRMDWNVVVERKDVIYEL